MLVESKTFYRVCCFAPGCDSVLADGEGGEWWDKESIEPIANGADWHIEWGKDGLPERAICNNHLCCDCNRWDSGCLTEDPKCLETGEETFTVCEKFDVEEMKGNADVKT